MVDAGAIGKAVALALVCAVLLGGVRSLTGERIAANEAERVRRELGALVGDARSMPVALPRGEDACVHLGTDGLAVMQVRANGYAGPIELLFTLRIGTARIERVRIERVRVVRHQETPGITDFLATADHGWIERLRGLDTAALESLDTVSGATVTSRAIRDRLAATLAAVAAGEVECAR